MVTLRIQHPIQSFEAWKRAFDADPVGRKASGVRRYRIWRPVADPHFVLIDLELETVAEAEGLLQKLRAIWNGPAQAVMSQPEARIVETIAAAEL
ncbi:MAG TPA: hypothetical protein VJN18_04330 [Polyangiaceae bacterium]|nr:hypothetical protein [Polyangiaceae bacterium]